MPGEENLVGTIRAVSGLLRTLVSRHTGVGIQVVFSHSTLFVRNIRVKAFGSPENRTRGGLQTRAASTRAQVSGAT